SEDLDVYPRSDAPCPGITDLHSLLRSARFACDKYAAARRSTPFSCSNRRVRLRSSRSYADSSVDLAGLLPASLSAWRSHFAMSPAWTPESLAIWAIVVLESLVWTTRMTSSRNSFG